MSSISPPANTPTNTLADTPANTLADTPANTPTNTSQPPKRILVSACLVGHSCRYDGDTAKIEARERVLQFLQQHNLDLEQDVVAVCPEQLGGLSTPRPACIIDGESGAAVLSGHAKVIVADTHEDVSQAFITGAEQAVAIARRHHITHACLKARSPSCGVGCIHTTAGKQMGLHKDGVAASLLKQAGLHVFTDEDI